MSEEYHCTPSQLHGLVTRHLKKLEARLGKAIEQTAEGSVPIVRRRAPKAFGDLQGSVHAVDGANPKLVVDAPHAGAVEVGSAPHTPDLEKLTAWVKLRGMQGLGRIRSARLHGPTTRDQAVRIRTMLRAQVQQGSGGSFSPIDSPEQVARAIAKSIEVSGTKPHWFVRESLPEIAQELNKRVRRALNK